MQVQFGPLGQCLQPAGNVAKVEAIVSCLTAGPNKTPKPNTLMVARKGNPYDVSQSRKVLSVTILRVNVRK